MDFHVVAAPAQDRISRGFRDWPKHALLALAAALPVLAFSGLMLVRYQQDAQQTVEASLREEVSFLLHAVEARLGEELAVLGVIAARRDLSGMEPSEWRLPSEAFSTLEARWSALALVDRTGRVMTRAVPAGERPPPAFGDPQLVGAAVETGAPAVSGILRGGGGEPYVLLGVPLRDRNGATEGALVAALPAWTFNRALREKGLRADWQAFIVDADRRLLALSNAESEADPRIGDLAPPDFAPGRAGVLGGRMGDGVDLAAAAAPSALASWTIFGAAPESVVFGAYRRGRVLLWSGGLLALMGAGVLGATVLGARARSERSERSLAVAQASREADRRYRFLAETIPQIVWTARPDGALDYMNPQWSAFTGMSPQAGLNGGWARALHPDDAPIVISTWAEAVRTERPWRLEYRARNAAGVYCSLMGRAAPMRDDSGAIRMWIGTATDISEIVAAREALGRRREELEREVAERTAALAASEARFRAIFQNVPDMVFLLRVGRDGVVTYEAVNPAVERLAGCPAAELVGRRVEDVLPGEAGATQAARYRACAASQQPMRFDTVFPFPDKARLAESILLPLSDLQGDGVHVLETARDITDRQELERQLAEAQKMEAVGQLTGGVAHDFNNLLLVVLANLELLESSILRGQTGRAGRLIGNAKQAVERGARLTAQLLAFSRRQSLYAERVLVSGLITHLGDVIRGAAGPSIEVDAEAPDDLWACQIDPAQFESAILNLVFNARDAMPAGGAVRIIMANAQLSAAEGRHLDVAPGEYVKVSVRDTGQGMPADVLARAFEPFFTTKAVGQGSGLGLAQVHGFVHQSGGAVSIESAPGRGTTVTLYFPRDPTPEPIGTPAPVSAGAGGRRGTNVLVVEDEPDMLEAVLTTLADAGHHPVAVASGAEALAALRTNRRFDVLLCDVDLPGGTSGIDLAYEARHLRPDVCVLLTSSCAQEALARQGVAESMQVLTKPYLREELLTAVAALAAEAALHRAA